MNGASAGEPGAPPLLAAREISRRFGEFWALRRVDFAIEGGAVHALLGENGAGKSTLMNLLSGLLRPTAGELLLDGKPVRWASARDAARAGIGMVHQHFLLVPTLTVAENLLLGAPEDRGGPLSYPIATVVAEAQATAERLGWRIPFDTFAGDLPVGTQQRVEILKALRGQTRVLIFDEPTAVLSPTETPELFATIRALAAEGRGIVFISHKLDEVLALAQRVTVLRRGEVVLRTTAAETDAPQLAAAMVGGGALTPVPSPNHPLLRVPGRGVPASETASASPATPQHSFSPLPALGEGTGVRAAATAALRVTSLTLRGAGRGAPPRLSNISFTVTPGEIFGVAGVDGNGQAELADCLSGLLRPDAGTVRIGDAQPPARPAAFRRAGVAVIPADRQGRGLALPMTLTENLALGMQDDPAFRRGPLLLWPRLRRRADDLLQRFDVRAAGSGAPARALSGGNQQKVVIARALAATPRVLIAVNPTRGLDVHATGYVHQALKQAAASGAAIVLISTELDEILALADRVGVLYAGRLTGIVAPTTPRAEIGLLMGGGQRGENAESVVERFG